ncbi:MAG: DUF6602 domain-containing protein [Bellilinea sp.]
MKTLDIPAIFKSDADEIIKCREDAIRIHGTNIRAAGNETEMCFRDYLRRMLPPRYYVAQGHLLDMYGNASSQLDIIISDNFNLPSLQTTKDGTRYIPIDSVYSVGEIKSTYYKSKHPIEAFSETIQDIRENLYHPDILNTAFGGITDETLFRDIVLEKENKVLNRIFFFALFVDGGNFDFEDIKSFYANRDSKHLPNIVIFLNKGVIFRASFLENTLKFYRYPEDSMEDSEDWCYCPFSSVENGSLEGNHLGFLYYMLVEHLANSYLEPPSLKHYVKKLMVGRKSLLKWANVT